MRYEVDIIVEQCCSITMSQIIATLLLTNKVVSSIEIVNFESKISNCNVEVEIEDDDIDYLFLCVEADNNMNFRIKIGLDYDSAIMPGLTVRSFLINNGISNDAIRLILDSCDDDWVRKVCINQSDYIKGKGKGKVKKNYRYSFFKKLEDGINL